MHAPHVNACPWHRRCFCQIELVKRSCWSFPPPEIASLPPFSLCPKTVFPRFPLVTEPLSYPSPADIPVLYSRVLQTNVGRSHPKPTERVRSTACTCLTQLCNKPTHLNHEGKPNSLLDLVFINDTDTFHSSVDVLPPTTGSTSDHLPVVVHYCPAKDNLSQYNPYPSKKYIKWNFHKNITIIWPRHSFLKTGNMSLSLL